ncbi:MAG: M28 family peptidase [Candidatus Micrarchaeia archaeon]
MANDGKIIVSVHCDVIWQAAHVKFVRRRGRRYYEGNLDNVVCVAAVLRSVMPRVRDRKVKFYFTNAEETTMKGARKVMRREGKALYVVVDVTQAARSSDVNIEWMQHINRKALKKVLTRIPNLKVGFKTGHPDETAIYGTKYPTFSITLPLQGNMHGKSKVSFWKVKRFGLSLVEILRRIRMNYDRICEFQKSV